TIRSRAASRAPASASRSPSASRASTTARSPARRAKAAAASSHYACRWRRRVDPSARLKNWRHLAGLDRTDVDDADDASEAGASLVGGIGAGSDAVGVTACIDDRALDRLCQFRKHRQCRAAVVFEQTELRIHAVQIVRLVEGGAGDVLDEIVIA